MVFHDEYGSMADISKIKDSRPQVIILNGVSSVSKTSLAKALQDQALQPFLHVQLDNFLAMLPRRTFDQPDGLIFEQIIPGKVAARFGPTAKQALVGMRHAIAAMVKCGNHIIVDDIFFDREDEEYRQLLRPYKLLFIGLYAPLAIIEHRERARGDRHIGLAKGQYDHVHQDRVYDLEIDTSLFTPDEMAKQICDIFGV